MSKKDINEDIVFESEEESTPQDKLKKIKNKLKSCETERKEYLEGWQKARADLINLRKQDEEEKKRIREFAKEDVVLDLVSVLDSFDMAFSNKESWQSVSEEWRVGVEYIHSQLLSIMQSYGLTEINPVNEKFDPELCEAVETREGKDNIVVEVIRKGYRLKDKIVRTAKVAVGKD
ncbi:MAG: nucleotide exchange factor GrpE [Candidatus Pacebacteria bacterium]|nr:nucleotide exchange factor GrpE [Candidatus Paceibacterota bacterium]